ncbi:MAG: 1-phosphofructokinase [Candidatus Omnitrophica bacterium]|nr:1-phosphofructokinase [Candidatus Omnitrophota bacterium]
MILTVTLNPSLDEWVELPSIRLGELNRAKTFHRYAGGKGINVSRVVRELGGQTVACGFAGGEDGLILRQQLNRLGVPHRFVEIAGTTRNNYKILTRQASRLTEINTAGPRVQRRDLDALQRALLARAASAGSVVLSGSLPPGAPVTIYARWIRLLHRRNVPVALDASGEALRAGLVARPWLIKPNRREAEELLGRSVASRTDAVRALRALLARGPEIAILSLGKDGALLGCAFTGELWEALPPAVRVVSAVGAGDSLVAGFVVGWRRSRSLAEALRLGVACGAATALTPGTELCHRREVRRLLPRVRLRPLR